MVQMIALIIKSVAKKQVVTITVKQSSIFVMNSFLNILILIQIETMIMKVGHAVPENAYRIAMMKNLKENVKMK
jgi:hypothetical protein